MFDPLSIVTAIIPMLTHAGGAVVDIVKNKYAPDNLRPSNVSELIAMQDSQIRLYTAMNGVGGETYKWVEAVIKMQRPLVVAAVAGLWCYAHLGVAADTETVDNAMAAVGFYLFADRTLFYTRKAGILK